MAGLLVFAGYALLFIGWVWMVVTAIKTGKDTSEKAIWGLVTFLLCWVGGLIFFIVRKQGKTPLMVEIAGVLLIIVAMVVGGGQASFNLGN